MPVWRRLLNRPSTATLFLWFFGLGLILALTFLFGELRLAANRTLFNDDMRTLFWTFALRDPQLFPNDYTLKYMTSIASPVGYGLLQRLWATAFDPEILHRCLPLVLWLACVPAVFIAARHLRGIINAYVTTAIFLVSSAFIFRMTGGLAHTFAFPVLWWLTAGMLSNRPLWMALAVIASAAFYPAVTPVAGTTMAFWTLFSLRRNLFIQTAWKPLARLAVTGLIAITLVAPLLLSAYGGEYGRRIAVFSEDSEFPESGPEGRHSVAVTHNPFGFLLLMYLYQHSARLGPELGTILTLALGALLLFGIVLHDKRDRRPARLRPLFLATLVCFVAASLLEYNTAYRTLIYPAPILILLIFPLVLRRLAQRLLGPRRAGTGFIVAVLCYIALIGKAEPESSGYLMRLNPSQVQTLDFITTLPKDALIAGWPGEASGGIVENVPYFAQRSALVTYESHAALHTHYVLTMRERMNALVDAYLATGSAPVQVLRDRFGVDYLIVNAADFEGSAPPAYFEPFNRRATARWKAAGGHFYVLQLAKEKAVYGKDDIYIIDLRRL